MQSKIRMPDYALTVLILGAILWLTLSPRPTGGMHLRLFAHQDKVAHALMFGALTWAWCRDRVRTHRQPHPIAAAVGATILGAAIELAQEAMHLGRSAEWGDLAADASGALLGIAVWWLLTLRNSSNP